MSNKYELSVRDGKTVSEYGLYIIASIILANTTGLNELLCLYIGQDTASLIISLVGVVAKKYFTNYTNK